MSLPDILKLATAISLLTPLFIAAGKWLQDRAKRRTDGPRAIAQDAQVVQGMTLQLLKPLQDEVGRLTDEVRTLRTSLEAERHLREAAEEAVGVHEELARAHGRWDRDARDLHPGLPEPPPLLPPAV